MKIRNKKKKIIIISAALMVLMSFFGFLIFRQNNHPNYTATQKMTLIKIKVSGAIEFPAELFHKKGVTLRQILFKHKLKTNADISNLDLERVLDKDEEIKIPVIKNSSIKPLLKSAKLEDLVALEIRKGIAQKVIDYIAKNKEISWEGLSDVKGVGDVTINTLKENYRI
ncbi:MAG0490 family ComEA-like DNA-binding protein [Mycoplasma procyoni]|uniref:MAG0490 family ComEA-like DNA-binding protein n=1 Tax=Mycoplasma procyoni TaxID=568784 RepID=UPI00197C0669|nr:hypothetical protein [Mycoplasma procyoni]MBN3535023.1 hypothetical protein [Mycoplasma procyoni]